MQSTPEVQELLLRINASTALLERELKKGADAIDNLGTTAERASGRYDRSMKQVEDATRRSQFAMRNLGFQIQDIGTSLASGSSPFVVLAQQGGQVAGALTGLSGIAGRLGAFLTGPFGATLLTAGTLLGALWFNSRKAADGAEELTAATDAQTKAIQAVNALAERYNATTEKTIALSREGNIAKRDEARRTIELAQAELAAARARVAAAQAAGRVTGSSRGDTPNLGASFFEAFAGRDAADIQKRIDEAQLRLNEALQGLRNANTVETATRREAARASTRVRRDPTRPADAPLADIFSGDPASPNGTAMWEGTLAAIRKITDETDKLGDNLAKQFKRANEAQRQFNQDLSRGLGDAIVYGGKFGDVIVGSIRRAAAEAISTGFYKLLTGTSLGSLGGALASVFGGARETGGPVMPGKAYLVGEKRPELFVPNTAGRIVPRVGGGDPVQVIVRTEPSPLFVTTVAQASGQAGRAGAARLIQSATRPQAAAAIGMGR